MNMKKYRIGDLKALDGNELVRVAQELGISRSVYAMLGDPELRGRVIAEAREKDMLDESVGALAAVAQTAPMAAAAAATPVEPVSVGYGAHREGSRAFVGKTVAEVLNALRSPWGIARDARVYVNGVLVTLDRVLVAGEVVEVGQPAGEKAAS
ncbi:MAG: hypothetical protein V1723_04725 [Candidatus Uhrbacteria bacterium]